MNQLAIERLIEEIQKLAPKQKEELFHRLGLFFPAAKNQQRGGEDDPFSELIGLIKGPGKGSINYKDDLYGNKRHL